MKCERCLREEAKFRVRTDLIDMKVCAACAAEARRLGLAVEILEVREAKNDRGKTEFAVQDCRLKLSA
jgi:protein-arginine kinase activator protein McsA